MKKQIKEEVKKEVKDTPPVNAPKMRQIIIETDGNAIKLVKAEVSGSIELKGILQDLFNQLNQPVKK